MSPLLKRIASFDTASVTFTLDGAAVEARSGETVLAAMLTHGSLRLHEADGTPRAGFCLMGACQDCWVWLGPDRRGRACTTLVSEGLRVFTGTFPPEPR